MCADTWLVLVILGEHVGKTASSLADGDTNYLPPTPSPPFFVKLDIPAAPCYLNGPGRGICNFPRLSALALGSTEFWTFSLAVCNLC